MLQPLLQAQAEKARRSAEQKVREMMYPKKTVAAEKRA